MKKNKTSIIIILLIIFQTISILKISDLKRQIQSVEYGMERLYDRLRNDVDQIYSNVDETLRKKASLVESASFEIGRVEGDELTVPITFSLTPKEVSHDTLVNLDFDGEIFPMEREGTKFTAVVSRDIFGHALPKIVIDDKGVKKTMEDDEIGIWSIKEMIFPTIHARLDGTASFSSGNYRRVGNLNIEIKEAMSHIEFKKMELVAKIDDEIISNEKINKEDILDAYKVDKKEDLKKGEIYTLTVVATDSLGLKHHYIVDHWLAGSNSQREPWFDDEEIYSPDGKILWQSR